MSYINPQLQPKFESLSIDLKNAILERKYRINTMQDLIKVLGERSEGKYSPVLLSHIRSDPKREVWQEARKAP